MKNNLRKELLQAGASKNEAENLARLAAQLHQAKPRGLSATAKQRMYNLLPVHAAKERQPILRWAFAGSLTGAMALLLIITQVATPKFDTAKPSDEDIKTLIQPTETVLQELDMKVEELQQQDTVDEAQLQETEKKYQDTYNRFKEQYQNNKHFKNYNWKKWQRTWQERSDREGSANTSTPTQTEQSRG